MSPASSSKQPTGPYRRPKADVYTVLLILALVAIVVGILCLYFELDMYQWKFKGGPSVGADRPSTQYAAVSAASEFIAAVPAAGSDIAAVPAAAKRSEDT